MLHELGRWDEAAFCFEKILKGRSPAKEFASFDIGILGHKSRHALATVYSDSGREEEAEELLRTIRKSDPEYSPAAADLARLLIGQGRGEEAEEPITLLREKGFTSDALILQGLRHQQEKRYERAAASFRDSLRADPSNEEALKELVGALVSLGRLDEAEDHLRARAALMPRCPRVRYNLAGILRLQGRIPEAIGAVDEALELEPDYALAADLRRRLQQEIAVGERSA